MTTPTARRPATIALPRAVPATAAPVVPAPAVPPSVAPAVAPAVATPAGAVPARANRTVAVPAVEFPAAAVQEVEGLAAAVPAAAVPATAVPATTPPAQAVPTAPVRMAAGPVVAADGAAAGLPEPGARRAPAMPPPGGTPGSPPKDSPGRSSSRPRARSAPATRRPGSTTTGGGVSRQTATGHRGSPRPPRRSSPNGSPEATPDDAGGSRIGPPFGSPPVATRADSLPAPSKRTGRQRHRSSGFPLPRREAYATGLPSNVHHRATCERLASSARHGGYIHADDGSNAPSMTSISEKIAHDSSPHSAGRDRKGDRYLANPAPLRATGTDDSPAGSSAIPPS